MYLRFPLNLQLNEEMLLESGILVSFDTVHGWVLKFGPAYVRSLKRNLSKPWLIFTGIKT
ncbi:IS6 family transposase [Microvirga pakistanensis]|uniref:IS6 family transposase n=1 Tax=Microvirga pakistanensis TaxID=1682650 RepID=UPI00106D9309